MTQKNLPLNSRLRFPWALDYFCAPIIYLAYLYKDSQTNITTSLPISKLTEFELLQT